MSTLVENPAHWADQAAKRVVGQRGIKEKYVLASGITPSGAVHIGNFREVITVDLVARALRDAGKGVHFLYSWDSFDTFRKIPKGLPQAEMMEEHLRKPICRIPDTRGSEESYAKYSISQFEGELSQMGVEVEFQYQHERYSDGRYGEGIRKALENTKEIKAILDKHRSSPLADSWVPTAAYCEKCDKDEMDYQRYDGEWDYSYKCTSCGHEGKHDIRSSKHLKLNWRIDWPMRWAHYGVDFEPGGKDHSSDGGSYDTGKDIVKEVYGQDAPIYLQYDFVSIKGGPGKMSSSSGNVMVLSDVLEIYSPEMVRYIFAKQKPNTDFSIAFDEDVIKLHDEFDRLEVTALEVPEKTNKKWDLARRVYELSMVDSVPETKVFRAGFRVLCNRLQICGGDGKRALERYYAADIKNDHDRKEFLDRCKRAWTWLATYAPDEFKYAINSNKVAVEKSADQEKALGLLHGLIESTNLDEIAPKELNQAIYDTAIHGAEVDPKDFFKVVYQHLINRDQGPRLPGFLKEIGKERLLELL
jgi:lysyl-tRNA synthetase, class I